MKRFRNLAFLVLVLCVVLFRADGAAQWCLPDPYCECSVFSQYHLWGTCPYYDDCSERYPTFCNDAYEACEAFCGWGNFNFDCYPSGTCWFQCYCIIVPDSQ